MLQWTGKELGVRQTPCGDARMEMHTHSYTPRDLHPGAETDAQTQGAHKATEPEKYTDRPGHSRCQVDAYRVTHRPRQAWTHNTPQRLPCLGTSPCPFTRTEEEVAQTAEALAPKH